jgi:hypothetical protein
MRGVTPEVSAILEADRGRDLADVGAELLGDRRDLVDERDLDREERVRRVLGELDRRRTRDDQRGTGVGGRRALADERGRRLGQHAVEDRLVRRRDDRGRGALPSADHDAIGDEEVGDGRALGEELRVDRHVQIGPSLLEQHRADVAQGADRRGAPVDDDRPGPRRRRERPRRRDHRAQIGAAVGGRERRDADEDDLRAVERHVGVGLGAQPTVGERADGDLLEPGLDERDATLAQGVDAVEIDVVQRHLMPDACETSAGHQADMAGAEDGDPHGSSSGRSWTGERLGTVVLDPPDATGPRRRLRHARCVSLGLNPERPTSSTARGWT